jgi:glycosyltransferase involved in cell wall biosynthesis
MIEIFYDITRIIERSNAITPTGIDRVDIKYASHINNSEKYNAHFIFLFRGTFYLCNKNFSDFLIREVYSRWIESSSSRRTLPMIDEVVSKHITKEKLARQNIRTSKVDGSLLNKLSSISSSQGFYLNCSHLGVGQLDAYYIFKTLGSLRIVFYLHDIIPIDFPEYVQVGDGLSHQERVDVMANFSDLIIVNSEYTRDRFVCNALARNNHIPPIEILYIGVEEVFNSCDLVALPRYLSRFAEEDYFVCVGTIEPRKNHLMILNLWRRFFVGREPSPKLVLLGKRGWNNQMVFDLIDRSLCLRSLSRTGFLRQVDN